MNTALKFTKMHGLGNDFVIVDQRGSGDLPEQDMIERLSNRKTGIGCDQLIVLSVPETANADLYMHIFNSDGTVAGACGNATRCVADILLREKGAEAVVIETVSGFLECKRAGQGAVTVDMGAPKLDWQDIPLSREVDTLAVPLDIRGVPDGVAVNMGNPHCVLFMDESVGELDLKNIGPQAEHHTLFPDRVNTEFVNVISPTELRMRVWERGAGETQACGSGACAVVVAAVLRGLADRQCDVVLDGGTLSFEWRESDDHVLMTGPVAYVCEGTAWV